jgi:hypothetical protein
MVTAHPDLRVTAAGGELQDDQHDQVAEGAYGVGRLDAAGPEALLPVVLK